MGGIILSKSQHPGRHSDWLSFLCPQEWEGRGPLDPGSPTRVVGNGKQLPRGACRGWACRDGTPPLSSLYSEAVIPCRYPTARAVIPIRASAGRLTAPVLIMPAASGSQFISYVYPSADTCSVILNQVKGMGLQQITSAQPFLLTRPVEPRAPATRGMGWGWPVGPVSR